MLESSIFCNVHRIFVHRFWVRGSLRQRSLSLILCSYAIDNAIHQSERYVMRYYPSIVEACRIPSLEVD